MKFTTLISLLGVAAAADKLQIGITHKPASCDRKAKPGDVVSVHYAGRLEDGTEFDNSFKRGRPFDFNLGGRQVIAGWDQGILGMCVGEKRRLIIPPELGYGASNMGTIPPHSTLIFDTELVAINGVGAEEADESDEEKEL